MPSAHTQHAQCIFRPGRLTHFEMQHPKLHEKQTDDSAVKWGADEHPMKPCLSPDNPPGCKTLNTAKPHPMYMCMLLKTNVERWDAYGEGFGVKDVFVTMTIASGKKEDFGSVVQASLESKMAELIFVSAGMYEHICVYVSIWLYNLSVSI